MDMDLIISWKKKNKLIFRAFESFCKAYGGTNKCTCFSVSSSSMLLLGCDQGTRPFQCQLRGIQCLLWTTFTCSDSHVVTWNLNSATTASLVYNSAPIIVQNTKLICFHEFWVGLSSQRKLFSSSSVGKAKVWPGFVQELPTLASATKSAFPSAFQKILSKKCDLS